MHDPSFQSDRIVTVFGGSGFVGRHLVKALAKNGWRVRVASRRPDLAFHLQPSGKVGQIHAVQANIRYPASIAAALKGSDAVINLVGILAPSGQQSFDAVQAQGAKFIAEAAAQAGIETFVHMSAIGADDQSNSDYARTKRLGETYVQTILPHAKIARASVIFGPEDAFFNRFAALARISPFLPLIGGGKTLFQPVYVADVAEGLVRLLDGQMGAGQIYEFGGPDVLSFKQILTMICKITGRSRMMIPIPFAAAHYLAFATEIAHAVSLGLLPSILHMTRDQMELLKQDNLVSPEAIQHKLTLEGLGIEAQSCESIVPSYLYRFRKTGQFEKPIHE
ncbi:MAG: complex I NDUFA9 subunit family protein [Alphaproteobacteria bacterium]|nr:complex I NDUFA9 subunit family protein [Alphaproteobacteria bacterium]